MLATSEQLASSATVSGRSSGHALLYWIAGVVLQQTWQSPVSATSDTHHAAQANPRKAFAQWVTRYHASYRGNKAVSCSCVANMPRESLGPAALTYVHCTCRCIL